MNKDLDERLVPNGEYRDAMNVQVSTSDGSDVGAVQNLLGNTQIPSVANSTDFCVGSIPDEKSDSLYWLNAGPPKTNLLEPAIQDSGGDNTATFSPWENYWTSLYGANGIDGHTTNLNGVQYTQGQGVEFKDTILEYKDGVTNPIFVDVHTKWFKPGFITWPSGNKRGDYLILPDNLSTSNGLVPAINGIQVGAKLNFYYYEAQVPVANSYLRKIEHTVKEVLPQVDLGTLPNSGNPPVFAGIIKDVIKVEVPLNAVEKALLSNTVGPDKYWFVEIENNRILNYRKEQLITGLNIVDDMLFWTDNLSEPKKISIPRSKQGTNPNGLIHTNLVVKGIDQNIPMKLENATVIKKSPTNQPTIEFEATSAPFTSTTIMTHAARMDVDATSGLPTVEQHLATTSTRDTILPNGNVFWDWTWGGHGTLPLPGRNIILTFQPADMDEVNTTPYDIDDPNNPGQLLTVGPTASALGNIPYKNGNSAIGDVVIFRHRNDEEDYIRCVITEEITNPANGWWGLQPLNVPYAMWSPPFSVGSNGVPSGTISRNDNPYHYVHQRMFRVEILTISQDTPLGWQYYDIRMEDKQSNLFERKFPRLALRYRYEDGEYSSFGPFTDAVFSPGTFEYDAKDASNKAMINNLKRIHVKDLINSETPDDVVQVDIVYKDEDSSNIYLVDNIKPDDAVYAPATLNAWDSPGVFSQGSYTIESESIFTALPSNQLLRPFDNVPRKALAQDVVGNRIVYGNYVQDYNLLDSTQNKITPLIVGSVKTRDIPTEIGFGSKSVKSEREYQLGVVYSDEFGRESSVLSSQASVFEVFKERSDKANQISAKVENPHPDWATHFKIFVKETTSEYYNLAMDRVYRAEDDGIWMSFPSAERNKVDEETYLVLKKPADTNVAVSDIGKYKVVAISNEAPEFIKTSYNSLGEVSGADLTSANANNGADILSLLPAITGSNILQQNIISFNIDKTLWDEESGSALDGSEPYLVSFFEPNSGRQSEKYEVTNFTVESDTSATATGNTGVYFFTLKKPITTEDGDWLESTTPGVNVATIGIKIYVKKIDNRPEFDGRFFVKIIRDSLIDTYITTLIQPLNTTYLIDSVAQLWWAGDPDGPSDGGSNTTSARISAGNPSWLSTTTAGSGTISTVDHYAQNPSNSSQHYNDWRGNSGANKGVIGNNNDGTWFIDNSYYAAIQPNNNPHPTLSTSFPSFPDPYANFTSPYPENYGRGIYQTGGKTYIELSFSTLGDDRNFGDLNTVEAWEEAPNLDNHQKMISAFKKQNQKFIINGDDTQYKVVDWSMQRRYNHTSIREVDCTDAGNSFNVNSTDPEIFKYFDATGSGMLATVQRQAGRVANNAKFSEANNRRLTFTLEVEPVDPNGADFYTHVQGQDLGDTGPPCRGLDATFVIEFISDYVDSASFDLEMSDNPTIWETEPKQKEGLDLYYEATRKFKGVLTSDAEVQELIPSSNINPNAFATMSTEAGGGLLPVIGPNAEVRFSDFRTRFDLIGGQYVPESHIRIIINDNTSPINLTQGSLGGNQCVGSNPVLNHPLHIAGCWHYGPGTQSNPNFSTNPLANGSIFTVNLPNGVSIELELDFTRTREEWDRVSSFAGEIFYFLPVMWNSGIRLSWYNCISFGNGVESDRIRDDFNALQLGNGVKVSRPGEDQYKEQHLKNSLIFSGLYNAKTGINNLNQFIAAEGITKDLNPSYGSIQKLHARDTDLVTLCEDKIIKVLSNKDAVFNADENPQLLATNRVLGQSIPFSGEYGISKDPESFAAEAYRAYFTDRQRGKVIRLSRDGITPISDYGMSDYFNDNLKIRTTLYGSYDIKRGSYNLTMWVDGEKHHTVSFNEKVKGWTSFKSFIPETALSLSGEYYTVKTGLLYQHHIENNTMRNTFYGVFTPSTVNVLLNANPEIVKNFQTLNYEGSQAKIDQFVSGIVNGVTYTDNQYYNLGQKKGWYVEKIQTNCEHGTVNEFIDKECKWFNYIKGSQTNVISDIDPSQFSFQGIADADTVQVLVAAGCTDPTAINYDPQAISNDGSCYYNPGCTDANAINYDPNADFDDGSCIAQVLGCLNDPTAINYGGPNNTNGISPIVNVDDGSCVTASYGCTDPTMFNYDPNATAMCDGGVPGCSGNCTGPGNNECCEAVTNGCTDPTATNYDPNANVDDGSCTYPYFDCTDPLASSSSYNPDPNAQACNDVNNCPSCANGTNPSNLCCDYGGCPEYANTNPPTQYSYYNFNAPNADPNVTVDDGSCVHCGPLDNTGGGGFNNMQVSFNNAFQNNSLELLFTNHTIQTSGSNTATPFELEIAYRESSCVANNNVSAFAFDNATQLFTDNCVTHLTNVNQLLAPPQNYSHIISNLLPGTDYDFAVRLRCGQQFWSGAPTNVYDQWYTGGELNNATTLYYGCTDTSANNYIPAATNDDGTCQWTTCTDPTANNPYFYNGVTYSATSFPNGGQGVWVHDPTLCSFAQYGCTDPGASNFDPNATVNCTNPATQPPPNGGCIPCDYTCDDPNVTLAIGDPSGGNTHNNVHIVSMDPFNYTSSENLNNPNTKIIFRFREQNSNQNWSTWDGYYGVGDVIGITFAPTKTYEFEILRLCADPFNQFQAGSPNTPNHVVSSGGAGTNGAQLIQNITMAGAPLPPFPACLDSNASNYPTPVLPHMVDDPSLCTYTSGCLDPAYGNYIGDGTQSFHGCPAGGPYTPPPVTWNGTSYDLSGVDTSCCIAACPNTIQPTLPVTNSAALSTNTPYACPGSNSKNVILSFSNLIFDTVTGQMERVFDGGSNFPANHHTVDSVTVGWELIAPSGYNNTNGSNTGGPTPGALGSKNSGAINTSDPRLSCTGNVCNFTIFAGSNDFISNVAVNNNVAPPQCNGGWTVQASVNTYWCNKVDANGNTPLPNVNPFPPSGTHYTHAPGSQTSNNSLPVLNPPVQGTATTGGIETMSAGVTVPTTQ